MTQEKLEQRARRTVHRFLRDLCSACMLGMMMMAIVHEATRMAGPFSGKTIFIVLLLCPALIALFRTILSEF